MSDPKEAAAALASTAASAAQNPALTVGRQLVAAREARKLSIDDVAQHLKYAPRQIEALEFDDYTALPGPTVIRGMIRSYARFVNVDAEPLLEQAKARLAPGPATVAVSDINVPFPMRAAGGHRIYWILSGLIAIAAAIFVLDWALNAREKLAAAVQASSAPASSTSLPLPVTPAEVPGIAPPVAGEPAAGERAGEAAVPTPAATAPAATPAEPVASAVPVPPSSAAISSGPTKRLVLRFNRESWVEVRDADGQVLMNRLNAAGTEATLDGKAPLRAIIGAASGVTVTFEGRSIDLTPATQVDVARLNLE